MKNSIPLPMIFFAIAIVATAGYFASKHASKAATNEEVAQKVSSPPKSKTYEDKFVSFTYPNSHEAWSDTQQNPNERFWVAEYPDPDQMHPAKLSKISISYYPDRKESRSLEEIYKSKNWDARHIYPPKTVLLDGGKCLTYRLDYGQNDNRVDANGRTRTLQTCTQVENQAHCYADDGRFFEVHAYSGGFCDRQNPDPETEEKLKAYNAFLHSLTFKPVS